MLKFYKYGMAIKLPFKLFFETQIFKCSISLFCFYFDISKNCDHQGLRFDITFFYITLAFSLLSTKHLKTKQ